MMKLVQYKLWSVNEGSWLVNANAQPPEEDIEDVSVPILSWNTSTSNYDSYTITSIKDEGTVNITGLNPAGVSDDITAAIRGHEIRFTGIVPVNVYGWLAENAEHIAQPDHSSEEEGN
jgi:hypothetical protein